MARKYRSIGNVRSGFTLVEALVAVAVTLIMMLALSQGFVMMSQSISEGRAKLTLSDQLRGISTILREDLEGMTAGGDPNSESCRLGYFEYYEGPISDYLPALVNFDSTQANLEEKNRAGRYGDFDDILSFTAKAKKGHWFYGEVPYPMVMGPAQIAAGNLTPTFTAEDWARTVTVASDTAEIIYFMMPFGADSTQFPIAPAANGLGPSVDFSFAIRPNLTPIVTDALTAAGVPSRMILCRRVLIVKPELNVPTAGTLFYQTSGVAPQTQLQAMPLGNPGSASPAAYRAYRVGMQYANQRCDLSVRRASDGVLASYDPIAANSLSDLQDPKNRFAHTVLPVGTSSDTTMPVWSLSGPIPLQTAALTSSTAATDDVTTSGQFGMSVVPDGAYPELGFILPQFMRQRRTDPATGANATEPEISFEMAFSEVVATNVIGFDVRGFDPSVTQFYHPGVDGTALTADDVIVSPGDPGYANVLTRMWGGTAWTSPAPGAYVARMGGFVDLGWPVRLAAAARIENALITANRIVGTQNAWATAASNITTYPQLSSSLSLTEPGTGGIAFGTPPFTLNAFKSGKTVRENNNGTIGRYRVYQPTFDTFTSRYETDGYQQTALYGENGGYDGTIWLNGQHQYRFPYGQIPYEPSGTPVLPASSADRGANGVDDNNVNGIDDLLEKDSAPPIASPLKAIQVIIRVEDKGANAIQQVAVDHELRLEN